MSDEEETSDKMVVWEEKYMRQKTWGCDTYARDVRKG